MSHSCPVLEQSGGKRNCIISLFVTDKVMWKIDNVLLSNSTAGVLYQKASLSPGRIQPARCSLAHGSDACRWVCRCVCGSVRQPAVAGCGSGGGAVVCTSPGRGYFLCLGCELKKQRTLGRLWCHCSSGIRAKKCKEDSNKDTLKYVLGILFNTESHSTSHCYIESKIVYS